jgi:alpha-beta hydrolase superfamily lysophospholipase
MANKVFFENGYDLYVLNYKMTGHCRKQGWVPDAHLNSHCFSGNFDCYIQDIQQALDFIQSERNNSKKYDKFLGYAHSTGSPILLNYLMRHGDTAFDGFVFNSPFLDWGYVGGDMAEFVLKHAGTLKRIMGSDDSKLGAATTPKALKDNPINYLGEEIVISDWSARIWSLYYFDWGTRPLYAVPMTVGFAKGVTNVHKDMEALYKSKRIITAKPFLVITARGDDVLKSSETLNRADWIGPARSEIELNDNGHNIFLSGDKNDTDMAIDMVKVWKKNKLFIS